jgi:hypothetical protein
VSDIRELSADTKENVAKAAAEAERFKAE